MSNVAQKIFEKNNISVDVKTDRPGGISLRPYVGRCCIPPADWVSQYLGSYEYIYPTDGWVRHIFAGTLTQDVHAKLNFRFAAAEGGDIASGGYPQSKIQKTIEKMRSDGEILENNYKFVRNV